MGLTDVARRALEWLRAGYPQGVPQEDYVVLLGVLRRRLTDDEVEVIAAQIAEESPATFTTEQIREAIEASMLQTPHADDVRRVSAALAAGGWPLAHREVMASEDGSPGPEASA